MEDEEIKRRLGIIETAEDFKRIFREKYHYFPGSPRRCAEELGVLTPSEKKNIADSAIDYLRRLYGRNWDYAGD